MDVEKRIARAEPSSATDKTTRVLLMCGAVAGPLYIILALLQGFIRDGFSPIRHSVSLLSIGDLGWIQITNFLVSGLLVIAGAAGLRRSMDSGPGRRWGPVLIGLYGVGLIGAGIFVADPMNGFPPGTPENASTVSWHGLLHFIVGGLGFLALIAACFVFARRFKVLKRRGWAAYSVLTGIIFFAAFAGITSGSTQASVIVGFWIGVMLAWTWLSAVMLRDQLYNSREFRRTEGRILSNSRPE